MNNYDIQKKIPIKEKTIEQLVTDLERMKIGIDCYKAVTDVRNFIQESYSRHTAELHHRDAQELYTIYSNWLVLYNKLNPYQIKK